VGKWEKRKGHDILGKCFDKAFTKQDNVKLVLMPNNPFLDDAEEQTWISSYLNLPMASHIDIIPEAQLHGGVAEVMQGADCGVFPSRAEGWNLELLEMMSCGKSVIATDYSAHTEFCNENNAYLIGIDDLEPAYDGKWFAGEGNWAEFDYDQEEQLIEHMRLAYSDRPTNTAGRLTAEEFSWSKTVDNISEISCKVA